MKQKIDNDKMWESLIRNSIGTDLYVQLKKSFKEQGLQYNQETKKIESINDDVFLKKGNWYLKKGNWYICIKDVYMNGKKDLRAYTKGSLYKCLADDTLPDDFGNDGHYWGEDSQQEKYFRPATEEEMPPSKHKLVEAVANEPLERSEFSHSGVTKESDKELTEFEEEFLAIVDSWCHGDGRVYKECNKQALKDARLLISIARKQLQPEFDAEIEKAYKNQDEVVYNRGYDNGYNEAIEDACEWLDVNYVHYLDIDGRGTLTANVRQLIEDLRKALEKGE